MKPKPFASLIISLIGLYSIFSAILVAGLPLITLLLMPFTSALDFRMVSDTLLMCIPQFLIPLGFGLFLFIKSERIASWVLLKTGIPSDESIFPVCECDLGSLAFALLGVFLLATTIPGGLREIAVWFQIKAAMAGNISGISDDHFWHDRIPYIIYHISAIGFSLFVFFRSKSISKFVASIRRIDA